MARPAGGGTRLGRPPPARRRETYLPLPVIATLVAAAAAAITTWAVLGSLPEAPHPSIDLLDVRLHSAAQPDGMVVRTVAVDWRNVGPAPVRRVTATVRALDPGGAVVWETARVPGYDGPPVPPDREYHQPTGTGCRLPDLPAVDNVWVEITGAS